MYFDFAVQRVYKIQRKIRLIALTRKLLANDDRFMNVARRTLWAMARIHEHIDVLQFSSTLFEIIDRILINDVLRQTVIDMHH